MPKSPASLARRMAHQVLIRVYQDDAFADRALAGVLNRTQAEPRDRAFATELVYGVLRTNRKLDFYIRNYSSRRLKKIQLEALVALRIGAYELLYLSTPSHSAVDESVNLLQRASPKVRGFTNGILRELSRHLASESLPAIAKKIDEPIEAIAIEHSIPTPVIKRVQDRRGIEQAKQWADSMGKAAPFTIRRNSLKITSEALQKQLTQEGIECDVDSATPDTLILQQPGNLADNLSFIRGEFSVQDVASQLVCHLVDPKPGEKIVDLCAAPGGKTTYLAELSHDQAAILGIDIYPGRVGLIEKAKSRLGIQSIDTLTLDATNTGLAKKSMEQWANASGVDRILLDAPCSGLGTLRRNPDMRLRPANIDELLIIQRELLTSAHELLKPGGYLIYSVCTFTLEESTQMIEDFLNRYSGYKIAPISNKYLNPFKTTRKNILDGEFIETWTDLHQCDGFFAIKLQKPT